MSKTRPSSLLQKYRYSLILLRQLVITDFKLRYQGSVLGYIWSLLRPLALFTILYFVFVEFLRFGGDTPHFAVYLLLGIVLWNYFSEVTNGGVGSIVGRGDVLRKLNFPRYVIVLAGSFSALINLAINLLVVFAFMLFTGADPHLQALLFVPLLIVELFVFAIALAFFLSALFVQFRDVNYIWEVIMQGAFYATPIIYPLQLIPAKAAAILILNPAAQIIQDLRYLLVTDHTLTIGTIYGNEAMRLVPVGATIFLALTAAYYFKKRSPHFAEEI
jgi:ABC-2 type transport system permease protein